jgi:hypothetical protein
MNYVNFSLVATDEIIASTGNTKVEVQHLDLSSLASVRKFARNIIDTEPRLDVLINNAGATRVEQKLTEDGLLLGMQVNHFGHFLLTCLLVGKFIIIFPIAWHVAALYNDKHDILPSSAVPKLNPILSFMHIYTERLYLGPRI